jgi:hypothetical protein
MAGVRNFVYKVCHNSPTDAFCPTGPGYKDLSHIDLLVEDITSCAGDNVALSVTSPSVAKCTIGGTDPPCGKASYKVIKCDIQGSFSVGNCFQFTLTVGGETAYNSAAGPIYTVSKGGNMCAEACILGPSCNNCDDPPPPPTEDEEFSRSPGFYSNHPLQTTKYLPIADVCGITFTHFGANQNPTVAGRTDASVTQALCINSRPGVSSYNFARDTLLRQLLAARLNQKVTNENGGSLSDAHEELISSCNEICAGGTASTASISSCVDRLSEFNDDLDTLIPTPPEFANPGKAFPGECKTARGDAFLFFK